MRAWIVVTGDELVEGRLLDTNGPFLAGALYERGVDVLAIHAIGDDRGALVELVRRAGEAVDVLVITGGLGGTADDLTRGAIADALGLPLVEDHRAARRIGEFFAGIGRPRPGPFVEAQMPDGARAIDNPVGVAPGIRLEVGSLHLCAMPGVPSEMRRMVADGALDDLRAHGRIRAARTLNVVGLPESRAGELLGELMERGRNPRLGLAAHHGELSLSIRAVAASEEDVVRLVEADVAEASRRLGRHVYSPRGESLPQVVLREMTGRRATLAVAESLTGGLVGHWLTEIDGASAVLLADYVCYANAAKTDALGVPAAVIAEHGAVSEPVARAMAEGARARAGADYGVATTGIAGPTGGSAAKPVGTVWVAAAAPDGETVAEHRVHPGARSEVKLRAARHAMDLLRRVVEER